MIEPFASGCGLVDYDNDGYLDLYFVNGANALTLEKEDATYFNRLYRNLGGFKFIDVTEQAGVSAGGYGMGVAVGDFDNDGYDDLFVTGFGENRLFHNQRDGTFLDVTAKAGVKGGNWSTSAAFIDFDRDGLLDLYVCRYLEWEIGKGPFCGSEAEGWKSYCLPDPFPAVPDILYRNNGDGTFEDISLKSGIHAVRPAKGLGVTVADFDRDGWPDIFVANDRHRDFLFRNRGDGTFEEVGSVVGVSYSVDGIRRAGMGTDFGDLDRNGWPDLLVTNFSDEGIGVYINQKGAYFEDLSGLLGVMEPSLPYVMFGIKAFDYDCDGNLDILGVTGHILDDIERYRPDRAYAGPTLLFRNSGGRFESIAGAATGALGELTVSRGAAFGDLDNDGDIDVIINNSDGFPDLLANEVGQSLNSILLKLRGVKSNRNAIGTRVEVEWSGGRQFAEVKSAASYLSANDLRVHFGLGEAREVEKVILYWPSGLTEEVSKLAAGYIHEIEEGSGLKRSVLFSGRQED